MLKKDTNTLAYTVKYGDEKIIECTINGNYTVENLLYESMGVFSTSAVYFKQIHESFNIQFTKGFRNILLMNDNAKVEYVNSENIPPDFVLPKLETNRSEPSFIAPKEAFESGVLYDFLNWTYYDGYFRLD